MAQQLKLRATHGKTSLRRLSFESAQADFALGCPQFQLLGRELKDFSNQHPISIEIPFSMEGKRNARLFRLAFGLRNRR